MAISTNKLTTLNLKKSNYIVFHSHQKKLDYQVELKMFDNHSNNLINIECKEFIKYLGVIVDGNLTWKYHIDNIASKISKTIGIITRLRYFVPLHVYLTKHLSMFNLTLHNIWYSCLGSSGKKIFE